MEAVLRAPKDMLAKLSSAFSWYISPVTMRVESNVQSHDYLQILIYLFDLQASLFQAPLEGCFGSIGPCRRSVVSSKWPMIGLVLVLHWLFRINNSNDRRP